MSRIGRKNRISPPENVAPEIISKSSKSTSNKSTPSEDQTERRTGLHLGRQEPLLQAVAFSDMVQDILHVDSIVEKTFSDLKSADRLTRTLKDQSSASLEIAKHRGGFERHSLQDRKQSSSQLVHSLHTKERDLASCKTLDKIEGDILCGRYEQALEAILQSHKAVEFKTQAHGLGEAASQISELLIHSRYVSELDVLKARLIRTICQIAKASSKPDSESLRMARLLGNAMGVRAEIQCTLEIYSRYLRRKLSSDAVNLSVSNTYHFGLGETSVSELPVRLASDIGFTLITCLFDAEKQIKSVLNFYDANPCMKYMFSSWAVSCTKEACEVFLRLVMLPLAVPKGIEVTSGCLSIFYTYCRAIDIHMEVKVLDMAKSFLLDPLASVASRHRIHLLETAKKLGKHDGQSFSDTMEVSQKTASMECKDIPLTLFPSILVVVEACKDLFDYLEVSSLSSWHSSFARDTIQDMLSVRTVSSRLRRVTSLLVDRLFENDLFIYLQKFAQGAREGCPTMDGSLKKHLDHALDWMKAAIIDSFGSSIIGLQDV